MKPIEIFFGTGGVGKTTLATSRALYLASEGHKVLLITIDPSLRLKQLLGISDDARGEATKVDLNQFEKSGELYSLLLTPSHTLARALKENEEDEAEIENNSILSSLSTQHGGLNEIMAVVELQYQISKKQFDCIIVDTPPGKHFVDFLNATSKIKDFFDKNFEEIFQYLGKKTGSTLSTPKKFITRIVSSGVKKLLGYLEKVTGADFVHLFIDTVLVLYRNKENFLNSLKFQETIKDPNIANLFLVTAVDHNKVLEAQSLRTTVQKLSSENQVLLLNRSNRKGIESWQPTDNGELAQIKDVLLSKETTITEQASKSFSKVKVFEEFISFSLSEQLKELSTQWEQE